jgi:hypothetical protein
VSFRFDNLAIVERAGLAGQDSEALDDPYEVVWRAIAAELSRQLHAAGAPDAPLEEQARTLLTSHRALAEAGEEMPPPAVIALVWMGGDGSSGGAPAIIDLFRVRFARAIRQRNEAQVLLAHRTQERDEARAAGVQVNQWLSAMTIERDAIRARTTDLETRTELNHANSRDAVAWSRIEWLAYLDGLGTEAIGLRSVVGHYSAEHVEMGRADALAMKSTRATRPEPSVDVVADLRQTFVDAWGQHFRELGATDLAELAGIHAVLIALAEMGEEAWPSVEEAEHAWAFSPGGDVLDGVRGVDRFYRSRLSSTIGALRARVAELEVNAALNQPLNTGGVTVRAVRRCGLCGGGGNVNEMPCGNCTGTGYQE